MNSAKSSVGSWPLVNWKRNMEGAMNMARCLTPHCPYVRFHRNILLRISIAHRDQTQHIGLCIKIMLCANESSTI